MKHTKLIRNVLTSIHYTSDQTSKGMVAGVSTISLELIEFITLTTQMTRCSNFFKPAKRTVANTPEECGRHK